MKSVLALLAVLFAAHASPVISGTEGGPRWLGDLDEAFALAAESGRPLLIVFR